MVGVLDGFELITEATSFHSSPCGEILDVEVENDVALPGMIGQSERGAVRGHAGEIRGRVAYLEHVPSLA